ncbi:hypothetical protein KKF34_12015 [Myxococcota bacterium]|nr:hypothetical protein [Myxococcota bacterium]MBU1382515.1 hypothetical protein [Myxococcota bacterium]MBU1497589.1 hypothetical protein [Myxococcota bacterium]
MRVKFLIIVAFLLIVAGCDDDKASSNNQTNNTNNTNTNNINNTNSNNTNNINNTNTNNTNNTNNINPADIVADHTIISEFEYIPNAYIQDIIDNFNIYYGHTSHGSQLITGAEMLQSETYDFASVNITEPGGDLGHNGDLTWETTTRAYLAEHPETNLVIWSWCGGVSDNTADGIQIYLDAMNQLELDFPDIIFVYMTGHTDGSGENGILRTNNRQIRNFCNQNNKILFDFEDIESWDPSGNYYPDISDDCAWCSSWCESNTCTDCAGSCAHSHCFNCYQKGKAFWWMLARIAGWEG